MTTKKLFEYVFLEKDKVYTVLDYIYSIKKNRI